MKTIAMKALLASFAVSAPMIAAAPALAQARATAVVDLDRAVLESAAYRTAASQIETTYAAQIGQVNTRATALNAEIQPLVTAFEQARSAPGATEQSVQPSFNALQTRRNAAAQEIARLRQPIDLARAYVVEQIGAQLDAALQAAMRARNVDLVVPMGAVLKAEGNSDITAAVVAELNRLVPSVQIVPPAGWQPGQQQQQQQAAPAAQPQQQQPQGR